MGEKSRVITLMEDLQEELDKITMNEVCTNSELQNGLAELNVKIEDWFNMISPKCKPFIIKQPRKILKYSESSASVE